MELSLDTTIAFAKNGMFWVLLLVCVLHVIFLSYHWFTYGTDRQTSLIALAVYVCGAVTLFMLLAFSLLSIS